MSVQRIEIHHCDLCDRVIDEEDRMFIRSRCVRAIAEESPWAILRACYQCFGALDEIEVEEFGRRLKQAPKPKIEEDVAPTVKGWSSQLYWSDPDDRNVGEGI